MSGKVIFDYYYGTEAAQFAYIRIPRLLFTDDHFKNLSDGAKILYGLMIERLGLSQKNKWFDEHNRAYIIYTVEDICKELNCASQKAVKLIKELSTDKGIGLIEKVRLGQGKANIFYVKNFVIKNSKDEIPEFRKSQFRETVDITENSDYQNSQVLNSENHNSEIVKNETQEFRKSQCNNQECNKPDYNNPIFLSNKDAEERNERSEAEYKKQVYEDILKEQIEYEILLQRDNLKFHKEEIDGIINIISDIAIGQGEFIRVGGMDRPYEVVKSRLLKINPSIIEYVIECLGKNTTDIRNTRSYLITTLYNAFDTMSMYYQNRVNHDFYGAKIG